MDDSLGAMTNQESPSHGTLEPMDRNHPIRLSGEPRASSIPRRRLRVDRIEAILRAVLALPASEPALDGKLPTPNREPLPAVVRIDAVGWLAWALGGLRVFSLPDEPGRLDMGEDAEGMHAGENTEDLAAHVAAALLSLAALAGALAGHDEPDEPEPSGRGESRRPWMPSIHVAVGEARRAVMRLALVRHRGNLTRIAASLETSRRALREQLKRAGLYTAPPWTRKVKASTDDASATTPDATNGGE
jgi:hypothetical protein